MPFARVVAAALLALRSAVAVGGSAVAVGGPAVAAAQTPPAATARIGADAPPSRSGLEVGALSSLALIVPGFGGQVSVPLASRADLEVSGEIAPWLLEDSDDVWLLTQVQLRVPVRERGRLRRSVVVGLSSFSVGDGWTEAGRGRRWEFESWLRPHAGLSWQWQRSTHLDVRLDLQAVIVGTTAPFAVPRVAVSAVWRKQGGRS